MYHYVRPKSFYPNVNNFLTLNEFRRQLEYFEKKNGFLNKNELYNFVYLGKIPKNSNKIILTFDDGLIDHYKFVYKELKKRKIWGIFYVNSNQYKTNKLLDVHRIHILLNKVPNVKLLSELENIIDDHSISKKDFRLFKKNTYLNQNYDNQIIIKRVLNYLIRPEFKENIIDELFKKFKININIYDFYLNEKHIIEMSKNGMIFGSHSSSHKVLSLLNKRSQTNEILNSDIFLKNVFPQDYKTFCIPYGTKNTFNQDTLNILKKFKFDFGFAVKSKKITSYDFKKNMYNLPRFDCNEFIN
tara:strand:+ start:563 stop:1462 length:900 start_codon:yes stop_codon:yes gene_type:complete